MEPPRNQTVPVNSVAQFTCITIGLVAWKIDGISSELSLQDANATINLFRKEGFTVVNDNKSVLLVNTTIRNYRTSIRCQTGPNRVNLNMTSEVAVLRVFGE